MTWHAAPISIEAFTIAENMENSKIEEAINNAEIRWTLLFNGEDQLAELGNLVENLQAKPSESGDGKQFASGFSYWGIGPTRAWIRACRDPFYSVMAEGILSFHSLWRKVFPELKRQPYHYVSLGAGTGEKDCYILKDLFRLNPNLVYLPVDMSSEMLMFGVQAAVRGVPLERCKILPVHIDFSNERNATELRWLLDKLLENEPILFSLLGNTLANFEDDTELLKIIRILIRPQDRLLLEVARTDKLTLEAQQQAAIEYSSSKQFRNFVTSALLQNTDLKIDFKSLFFEGWVEQEKAIKIKVFYRNLTEEIIELNLPEGSLVDFPPNDTIRLYLSRKYTDTGIKNILNESNFLSVKRERSKFALKKNECNFGLELSLLAPLEEKSIKDGEQQMVSILFLSADPKDETRLRLGEEVREIQDMLQLAKLREQFTLHQRFSVRPADLSQALLDIEPNIVHFSGHGSSAGELFIEDTAGNAHPISPEALSLLFKQFVDTIDCVILNACYSEIQAKAIAEHIEYVIGMNVAISDKAAIAFAIGFYQGLGAGLPIENAYNLGCAQIGMQRIPEHLTPRLIKRKPR